MCTIWVSATKKDLSRTASRCILAQPALAQSPEIKFLPQPVNDGLDL